MAASYFSNQLLRKTRSLFLTSRIDNLKNTRASFTSKTSTSKDITPHKDEDYLNENEPIKFSTSRAAAWKTNYKNLEPEVDEDTRRNKKIKKYIHVVSYITFLTYLLLREGNDLDDDMAMPLGKRVLTLHRYQLELEKEELLKDNQSTDEVDSELLRIANLRKQYKYDD